MTATVNLRRSLAAAAAATLLCALSACGGNDDKASDKSPTSSSSASGSASSTPSGSSSSTASSTAGKELTGPDFAAILKGALDKATTAHVTMDLGKSIGTADGDADYTKTPPEADINLTMAQLGGNVEVRMVGGTLYLKSASFGDKWVSASLDDPNSPLGALGSQLDITKTLQNFGDAVVSATDEGTENVDGESLEHYKATVDTSKLLSSLPSQAAGAASSLPKTMDQDWWFDSDGLIRKFSTDFGGQATTVSLSKWGEDVSIQAPPADQVTTFPGQSAG